MATEKEASTENEPAAGPAPVARDLPGRESAGYPRDEFDVDVVPGQRRGAHRVATPPLLAMLPWLLVGLFVVACLVTLVTFVGGVGQPAASPTAVTTTTASPTTTEAPPEPEIDKGVRLHVLNGTRTVRTRDVSSKLTNDGWIVERTANNSDRNVAATVVIYKSADLKDTADALVAFLGAGTVAEDPTLEEDMRILIGKDYLTNQTQTSSPTTS